MHVHPGRCVHPRGSRVLPAYAVRPHTRPGCRHAHPLAPRNNLVRRTQAYLLPGDLCRGVGDAQGQASAVGAEGAPEEGGLPGSSGETGWFALGSQEAWTCRLSAAASGWLSPEGISKVLEGSLGGGCGFVCGSGCWEETQPLWCFLAEWRVLGWGDCFYRLDLPAPSPDCPCPPAQGCPSLAGG